MSIAKNRQYYIVSKEPFATVRPITKEVQNGVISVLKDYVAREKKAARKVANIIKEAGG